MNTFPKITGEERTDWNSRLRTAGAGLHEEVGASASLAVEQARTRWQLPNAETVKCKRDRAILSILFRCGLRRRELAELTFAHLQQREDHWAVVDLIGKAGHMRTVAVPDWVRQITDEWVVAAGSEVEDCFDAFRGREPFGVRA
jgi:site-specific recombinase XerD